MIIGRKTPKSRIILGALLGAIILALLFSGRPWRGYNMPRVTPIAVLEDSPRLADVRHYTEIGPGIFPYIGGPRPELAETRQPLRLGYAYVEYGIFGLPYWVGEEYGMVTYLETSAGVQVAAITPGQVPLLDEMIGAPTASGYHFRWYLYIWGWPLLILFVAWVWTWRREDLSEEERLRDECASD
jgi:hypothetical protein